MTPMIRLIAMDLDGTLLTDNKELPPDFWELANLLMSKNISLAIASGRPFHNIASLFQPIKEQIFFVCDNGSYVVEGSKELSINQLDREPIAKIVTKARALEKVYPVLCGKDLAYIENTDEDFARNALKYYQEFRVVEDLTQVDDIILKVSLCDLIGSEMNSYPHFQDMKDAYSVAISGQIWLDFTNLDGTKGQAIKKIQEYKDISPDETLVFGDYLNDLDMIQNAHFSYAMKNAHPQIRKAANFVTESDNNHFGVTATIKKLFSL